MLTDKPPAADGRPNPRGLVTKFGFGARSQRGPQGVDPDSRPERIKQVAEGSLKHLRVDAIDLFYQHRRCQCSVKMPPAPATRHVPLR
jgi:aryl-alcohol dehydrogenase-like predicted oxidoreductase